MRIKKQKTYAIVETYPSGEKIIRQDNIDTLAEARPCRRRWDAILHGPVSIYRITCTEVE